MKLEIDFETADKITLTNLTDHYHIVRDQIYEYETGTSGLYEDDYRYNLALLRSLDSVIEYFGGPNYDISQEANNE